MDGQDVLIQVLVMLSFFALLNENIFKQKYSLNKEIETMSLCKLYFLGSVGYSYSFTALTRFSIVSLM